MGRVSRNAAELPGMSDAQLEQFWDQHEPEDFDGWVVGELIFERPPKKVIQLRLEPKNVRIIDKESKAPALNVHSLCGHG